jgi:hypothetical protein
MKVKNWEGDETEEKKFQAAQAANRKNQLAVIKEHPDWSMDQRMEEVNTRNSLDAADRHRQRTESRGPDGGGTVPPR